MAKGKIRHMFPGGNTSKGFYSFYSHIINPEHTNRLFILKGGPGTGKSTFMKRTAAEMLERGYDVELMHCSSDNNSLDGVVVPSIGIALIDGTAPHVVDPRNPGVIDEIINLGEFWNKEALIKHRQEILETNNELGRVFSRAYRYLRAARHIYEDSAAMYAVSVDEAKINVLVKEIIDDLWFSIPLAEKAGGERCLFASAITPDGFVNYLDDLLITDEVYLLEGLPGTGTERLLDKIKAAASERGFFTEAYYCAFNPDKLEHLIIPEIKTAFATVNKYHSTDVCPTRKINATDLLNTRVNRYQPDLSYNQSVIDSLIDKAIEILHGAKQLHDRLESYYIPNMDFNAVESMWNNTISRINEYCT